MSGIKSAQATQGELQLCSESFDQFEKLAARWQGQPAHVAIHSVDLFDATLTDGQKKSIERSKAYFNALNSTQKAAIGQAVQHGASFDTPLKMARAQAQAARVRFQEISEQRGDRLAPGGYFFKARDVWETAEKQVNDLKKASTSLS